MTPITQVASFSPDGQAKKGVFGKIVQTVASIGGDRAAAQPAKVTTVSDAPQSVGVAVAPYSTSTSSDVFMAPKPNLAPRAPDNTVIATLAPAPRAAPVSIPASATSRGSPAQHATDFASPDFWSAPAVPAALAIAMAGKERRQPGASLPIAPTAVVATVSISRVIAADAITSAVINGSTASTTVPAALAYAADVPLPPIPTPSPRSAAGSSPTVAATPPKAAAPIAAAPAPARAAAPLTMTALDTASLRLWMGSQSTRQRSYALLTMPDFEASTTLMSASAPATSGFSAAPTDGLRTDRFAPAAR
jgi:hypothetical protein